MKNRIMWIGLSWVWLGSSHISNPNYPNDWFIQVHRMTQNTRPTPPWLKLSQISNFLTGVGSPRSKWSEKVKKIIHSTLFGFRIIKTVFKKGPFLWYRPTNLTWFRWFWSLVRACILNFDFFSGHFNIGQPRFVKKFDTIWAMDVGVPCLNLANCPWPHFGWIKAWTHPFTDLVSVKFQISWLIWLCLCPNDQKKKEFDLQAFTTVQNH